MNAHTPGIHTQEEVARIFESESGVALTDYLTLQEESESPRTFLIWSLIAATAGLIGKNAVFYAGENLTIVPNLFVVLLGPSGVRKSSAISMVEKLIRSTSIYFGPTDTGNQRHGLMSALAGMHRPESRMIRKKYQQGPLIRSMIRPRDSSDMMLISPELGRLFGSGSMDMANFFVDLYDGARLDYQTKASETRINSPRSTLLTATTPSSLAEILPVSGPEHGITARMIFIYADKVYKSVPIPPDPTEEWWDQRKAFMRRLHWIDNNRIDFSFHLDARKEYNRLYTYTALTEDPRLSAYRERRGNTLIKIAICLCALRMDNQVIDTDILLAHELLCSAEPMMHKALEYFGRNKKHQGRMLMIQLLKSRGAMGSASEIELVASAGAELTAREAREAIQSMVAAGDLAQIGSRFMLGETKNELNKTRKK